VAVIHAGGDRLEADLTRSGGQAVVHLPTDATTVEMAVPPTH
jgi:hypothetical protein